MKKNLIVKQDGYKECGAASLLSIIRYYHGNISINRLVELTKTDNEGTTFYHLKKASEEIGMDAVGYQIDDINRILEIKTPFICQLINNHYEHFVVIYEIKKEKVLIMDPAIGEVKMKKEELEKKWTGYIMIFSPRKKLATYKEEKYFNQIIKKTIINNKSIVIDILLLSIAFTIVSFLNTLYFEITLDKIINTTRNNLLIITFIFSILLLIKCITNFFRNELLIYLNQKLDCTSFLNAFQKIILLPYSYYKNRTTGEIISRINDLIHVKNILNKIILTVCLDLIMCICSSIILLYKNLVLFLLLVIIIAIYVIIFYLFRPRLKKDTEIAQANSALLNSYLIETINGFETIKNIHLESIMNRNIENLYIKALNHNFEYNQIINLELFMKDIVYDIGLLLLQFIGISIVMNGKMSIGSLITFIFLANYIIGPIKNILDLNKDYFYAINSIKRANHLFEIETEKFEQNTKFVIQGNICINNLTFGYKEEKNILNNLTIKVEKGSKFLILGHSGSGKSTILKLLLKYYKAPRNTIYLDQKDINDYSLSNIREQISCISQNEILYNDTIRNNIIMGRNINEEKFQEIIKITHVDEFVKEMFLGYDTKLEENGLNLSGGQRQRIMLARMLLKESNILLIDEGLNAIDINLERIILTEIFSKYKNKTIIVVSHRTENQDLFDNVLKLGLSNNTHSKEITL